MLYTNIDKLDLKDDATATLTYSEGTDVFVHNESDVETAIENTGVIDAFCELITTKGLSVKTSYGENVIQSLRDSGLLEDYARDFTFTDYLSGVITDNFYDVDLIEYSTRAYDYKRGFCTLTATVEVPVSTLVDVKPNLSGWVVAINTNGGTLTLEG